MIIATTAHFIQYYKHYLFTGIPSSSFMYVAVLPHANIRNSLYSFLY